MSTLTDFLVTPEKSIREAISKIDRNTKGIVLIVDDSAHLIGTITDGDIRRAILSGYDLSSPVSLLLKERESSPYPKPVTAQVDTVKSELLALMNTHGIRQVPLLDEDGHVVDIAFLTDIVKEYELPLSALVMAGGFGKRLHPLTEKVPKPMLPVGDRPILELIIEQLKNSGIHRVNLAVYYKGDMIEEHFGSGEDFGVEIDYIKEEEPLGTAGALGFLDSTDEPVLIINGDILTKIDFRSMLRFHKEQRSELTVAVSKYDYRVPYGVLECDGPKIKQILEKPLYSFFVNAGIYLLQSSVVQYIPRGKHFDMTDLIEILIQKKHTVVSFPIVEYWLDIGQPDDYKRAQRDIKKEKKGR
ncbi:MAG: nucleotidyltransferase family protein [Deltaproteobacteria bacterium]|uniref:Nucleotidyltransferase family protein n=1 Tax=Candidatus Zymogenus saltonus TaxID=2844893 RepID=A0A9D8KCU9_9DELT|nr:nucleotidyltransferase family protein [Candidatus Zymogenus saltonus]